MKKPFFLRVAAKRSWVVWGQGYACCNPLYVLVISHPGRTLLIL